MIAIARRCARKQVVPAWHAGFLSLLPAIRRFASIAFRGFAASEKEEAVQEVICNALVAYHRLAELGRTEVAFPSVLARYGVAQFRAGRRVANRLNVRDVSSIHCQRRTGIQLEHLDRYDREKMAWCEVLIEDRHAGPAETAAARIDFRAWLRNLSVRQRRIALALAGGDTTTDVAHRFHVSLGRISQIRRELRAAWEVFVADKVARADSSQP